MGRKTSERKAAVARENGRKSKNGGPKTLEGKEASSAAVKARWSRYRAEKERRKALHIRDW